jgi:site-specific recombinase XerD
MHDELFEKPDIVARYRAGPCAHARERFLRQASAEGYSRSTLKRIAWVLLSVAEAVQSHGGRISSTRLRSVLCRRIRLCDGRRPSEHTARLLRRHGEDWLRSIGALLPEADQPARFARELGAFAAYMRVERGLSPVTIATREVRMCRFFSCLPSRVRSLSDVTIGQIDAFLESEAQRGWSRASLHTLGSSLRSFFRYAAQQGWCAASLALSIDLPRRYELEDVPMAPTVDEVDQLLATTALGDAPVTIRDHAVLSLLIHYGLRRGEVEHLTLDDIDWVAETLHVMRPKLRRPQCYPLSAPVGEAILRYLRDARPRCEHRAVFITVKAPFRPLSGSSISAMVRMRLRKQGVKLEWSGAHCLRHACAGQLLDAGFTLKQIADHLGHRSMSSTRIYTKIDLQSLRQVAELDLGALL